MSLSYDGKRIIPAPTVSLTKAYLKSDDGSKIGSRYQITLTGTLLPWRGSPFGAYGSLADAFYTLGGYPPDEAPAGNGEDFDHILRKQEALRWLFSQDGRSLEWQPTGGQPVVKCNPRVVSVDFGGGTGQWADRCPYTVTLEAEWIYINGGVSREDPSASDLIETAEDTWQLDEVDGHSGQVYSVTHTVTAKGILGYDETGAPYGGEAAWQHAKDWVTPHIVGATGDADMAVEATVSPSHQGQYKVSRGIDKTTGRYSATETWSLSPSAGYYVELAFSYDLSNTDSRGTARFEGTIHGVAAGKRSGHADNIALALSHVPSDGSARSQAIAELGSLFGSRLLKARPDTKVINTDRTNGVVRFSFTWSMGDTASTTYEASVDVNHGWAKEGSKHTLSMRSALTGNGAAPTTKLVNAGAGRLTDSNARHQAYLLAARGVVEALPVEQRFALIGRSEAVNERQGTIEQSWNWEAVDTAQSESDLFYDVSMQETFPTPVLAIIPIPERAAGPIIQDMGTVTPAYLTATCRVRGLQNKPGHAFILAYMAARYPSGWDSKVLQDKTENWDPGAGTYELATKWIKT